MYLMIIVHYRYHDTIILFTYLLSYFADITTNPKNTTTAVGTNVTLTCNATGADNLRYQWMRVGKKTIPSRAIGVDSNTMIIPNVIISDSGLYKCVISSGNVSVISKIGNVSVWSKLLI